MSCRAVRAHGKHCIAVRDALIELFEAPVIESNTVGRSVLASIFGDENLHFEIRIEKPVIDIASNPLLVPLINPGARPIVWETELKKEMSFNSLLDPISAAGQEQLCVFVR